MRIDGSRRYDTSRLARHTTRIFAAVASLAACTSPRVTPNAATQPVRATAPSPASCLRLTYVANEGVLLEGPEGRVLIDGLHRPYQPPYPVLPARLREQAETGQGIFKDINLVLVSHRHLDHFHAQAVARHLAHSPATRLISSGQVVDAVRAVVVSHKPPWDSRTQTVPATPGASSKRTVGRLEATLIGLRHARKEHRRIENLAHLLRLGGKTVLHVGDADRDRENFASLRLRPGQVDVALLPYWYYLSQSGRALIDQVLRPRYLVAFHLPPPGPRQTRWVRSIRRRYPQVVALTRLLSTWTPPDCRSARPQRSPSSKTRGTPPPP